MLKEQGYFSFTDENGKEIILRFNTWTTAKFSEVLGVSFEEVLGYLQKSFSIQAFSKYLLCAHQSYCLSRRVDFDATEYDATCWLDALGGFSGAKMTELLATIKLASEPKGEPVETKKKHLNGGSLNKQQQTPELIQTDSTN